jgi:hypothetical protein
VRRLPLQLMKAADESPCGSMCALQQGMRHSWASWVRFCTSNLMRHPKAVGKKGLLTFVAIMGQDLMEFLQ